MKKEKYVRAEIELIEFEEEDVITTSGGEPARDNDDTDFIPAQ